MTNKIGIIDPLQVSEWDEIALRFTESSIFHSAGWSYVLSKTYQYNPSYLYMTDADSIITIVPIMEVRKILGGTCGISLPFSDSISPLMQNNQKFDEILSRVLEVAKSRGWKKFQGNRWQIDKSISVFNSFTFQHTLTLDENVENIFGKFKSNTKRNIKKAIALSVDVAIENSYEAVRNYFKLHCETRKRHGLPPQPFKFFRNIYSYLISKNKGFVITAYSGKKPIASSIFLHFGKKAIYKYGASNKAFQSFRANNLIMWKAIEYYCKNGYSTFSFGITEPDNRGLLQFKRGWGALEKKVFSFNLDIESERFEQKKIFVSGFHNRILSRLPIPLLRICGILMYKYFP